MLDELRSLLTHTFVSADEAIHAHERLLFLRAYPPSEEAARLCDQILANFADRIASLEQEPFDDYDICGIAGTSISSVFSYEFAKSLADRHPAEISIDWQSYTNSDRLGIVLSQLVPAAREDYSVEPHVNWREWVDTLGGLAWLLKHVPPRTYDLLEIPLWWQPRPEHTRTGLRVPHDALFIHDAPLIKRREVSVDVEFAAPPLKRHRVAKKQAQQIMGAIIDASAIRYRELYGFSFPDLDHFYRVPLGRGVEVYYCGVPRKHELPARGYYGGMFFKNGVPAGYIEGLSMFERMEMGFNLYQTFREGETAWLYVKLLKLFRERAGIRCFTIDPYQIGHDNEEAIASGAFWFYYKLGFRPARAELAQIAHREEEKIAAKPGYRTSPKTLRTLANGTMCLGDSPEWGDFSIHRFALHSARSKTLKVSRKIALSRGKHA